MEVGAPVLNQDIRFVHPSQRATIGVGNLPYTRYGYIDGVLGSVSHDVIQGENFELSFQARMRMKEAELLVGGAKVNFAFGLLLTAEIHAGKRRVIEHILGPLRSGQERRCGGGRRTQIFTILRNGNV